MTPKSEQEAVAQGYAVWQRWRATVRRWFHRDNPVDVETENLRSLFISNLSSSPVSLLAALFLYFVAPGWPEGIIMNPWMVGLVTYHLMRMGMSWAFLQRSNFSLDQLRLWALLSWGIQLMGGFLMLLLALFIYPHLEGLSQLGLTMVVFIVVGASAFNLAGRWATIAVYATPTYFGFAWASWQSGPPQYAPFIGVLCLMFFALYLLQARAQHRTNIQSFAMARRNGELARELQIKNSELEEVATSRSRLLATVSHDLRQPAHAIGLLCERVMLDPSPDLVQQSLRDLNELSLSLSASLTTLMDLTRLDAGMVSAQMRPMRLSQVLLRLDAEFSGSARKKGLEFVVPQTKLWVKSDPVLLHGVLANLVSNAIKYSRKGRVSLELLADRKNVSIAVQDNGVGIQSEKFDLIFKEFVRLDASDSGTEGLGLGLSIVKRYAALMRHRLSVTSEPSSGSRFVIEVPLVAAEETGGGRSHAEPSTAVHDSRLVGLSVLVVDNMEMLLSSMVRTISAWGCKVHSAHNLAEARQVARDHALDMVISDFHLGDREPDGLTLIQVLRLMQPPGRALPCLLMTGDVSAQLEANAGRHQVRILHKPVRPAVLQDFMLDMLPPPSSSTHAAQASASEENLATN